MAATVTQRPVVRFSPLEACQSIDAGPIRPSTGAGVVYMGLRPIPRSNQSPGNLVIQPGAKTTLDRLRILEPIQPARPITPAHDHGAHVAQLDHVPLESSRTDLDLFRQVFRRGITREKVKPDHQHLRKLRHFRPLVLLKESNYIM
jgi:hypothetical protein